MFFFSVTNTLYISGFILPLNFDIFKRKDLHLVMLRKSQARESEDMKYSRGSLTCYVTLPLQTSLASSLKCKEGMRENKNCS